MKTLIFWSQNSLIKTWIHEFSWFYFGKSILDSTEYFKFERALKITVRQQHFSSYEACVWLYVNNKIIKLWLWLIKKISIIKLYDLHVLDFPFDRNLN